MLLLAPRGIHRPGHTRDKARRRYAAALKGRPEAPPPLEPRGVEDSQPEADGRLNPETWAFFDIRVLSLSAPGENRHHPGMARREKGEDMPRIFNAKKVEYELKASSIPAFS